MPIKPPIHDSQQRSTPSVSAAAGTPDPVGDARLQECAGIRPRSRWSDIGFQDLSDDEAFVVWLYRCWQHNEPTPYITEHRLSGLLRHDRLHALLNHLLALCRTFGRDPAMEQPLLGFPLLTWREETLLSMLTARPITVGADCDELARTCFDALQLHGVSLRPLQQIARAGRNAVEIDIARKLGGGWNTGGC
jgi:hypothetical protein